MTFHFGEDEVAAQLSKKDKPPRFAAGQGDTNLDVYYELADLCAVGTFSGSQVDDPDSDEKLAKLVEAVTNLSTRFMDAAERFMVAVLNSDGWKRTVNAEK